MGQVIAFPGRMAEPDDQPELDLLSAVDFAIRDLREMARRSGCAWSRERADECQLILQRAFDAELGCG